MITIGISLLVFTVGWIWACRLASKLNSGEGNPLDKFHLETCVPALMAGGLAVILQGVAGPVLAGLGGALLSLFLMTGVISVACKVKKDNLPKLTKFVLSGSMALVNYTNTAYEFVVEKSQSAWNFVAGLFNKNQPA